MLEELHESLIIVIVRDITMTEILRSIREGEQMKSMIMRTFLHELKTPLNGMLCCNQILKLKHEKLKRKEGYDFNVQMDT